MANPPRAGELRHRLAFDKRGQGNDGFGNTVTSWREQFVVSAAMRPRGGSEAVVAARLEGRSLFGIYLRSSTQTRLITTDWRARDARLGTEYAIVHVDGITDPAWVYLDIRSGAAA